MLYFKTNKINGDYMKTLLNISKLFLVGCLLTAGVTLSAMDKPQQGQTQEEACFIDYKYIARVVIENIGSDNDVTHSRLSDTINDVFMGVSFYGMPPSNEEIALQVVRELRTMRQAGVQMSDSFKRALDFVVDSINNATQDPKSSSSSSTTTSTPSHVTQDVGAINDYHGSSSSSSSSSTSIVTQDKEFNALTSNWQSAYNTVRQNGYLFVNGEEIYSEDCERFLHYVQKFGPEVKQVLLDMNPINAPLDFALNIQQMSWNDFLEMRNNTSSSSTSTTTTTQYQATSSQQQAQTNPLLAAIRQGKPLNHVDVDAKANKPQAQRDNLLNAIRNGRVLKPVTVNAKDKQPQNEPKTILDDIKQGTTLKHVDVTANANQPKKPSGNPLVDMLTDAMNRRRAALGVNDNDNNNDNDTDKKNNDWD
jgi:hypothetical protein